LSHLVSILTEASEDIFHIGRYLQTKVGREKAAEIVEQIEAQYMSLEKFPERGHSPPELESLGLFDFREIHADPYRIIYQVRGNEVFVHAVLDGRRDIQTLLHERLVR
jgi:toxin ParE1/3/4